jgi:probable rRNA maturation factor
LTTLVPLQIDILLAREYESWPEESALVDLTTRIVNAASKDLRLAANTQVELSVVFADDTMVQELNAQWRGKDRPTNVLSFPSKVQRPGEVLPPVLGDIILAFQTVEHEALHEKKPFENHVSHLVLHGFLHLLGYDHETGEDAEFMENIETRILATLAIPDPYALIDEAL